MNESKGRNDKNNIKLSMNSGAEMYRSHTSYDLGMFIPIDGRWRLASTSGHWIGGLPAQLRPSTWIRELRHSVDTEMKQFILEGVINGFPIVDDDCVIDAYDCANYKSATEGPAAEFISNLMIKELVECKLIQSEEHPRCIHSMGAVPKKAGKYRMITDCSRPKGLSINNYMTSTCKDFSYESLDRVVAALGQGDFMATVDIASAYRSVSIKPNHRKFLGIRWTFAGQQFLLNDTRLCFGLTCAPYIFSMLSKVVVDSMHSRGFTKVFCYLDDYIVIGKGFEECCHIQNTLIRLLGEFGFFVNWDKCSSPSTYCTYLGIAVDSVSMQISLPQEKLLKLHKEIEFFDGKRRATKRQIQRLAGVLGHCSKVVRGGRIFSRRIIDMLKGLPEENIRITLSDEFKRDIDWWKKNAPTFNGTSCIITKEPNGPIFQSDASLTGYGVTYEHDWVAGHFNTDQLPHDISKCDINHEHWWNLAVPKEFASNINVLEILPILLIVYKYGNSWSNQTVIWYTDNAQVMYAVNKGTCKNSYCMEILRFIFWASVFWNFHLICRHIPGKLNEIPDRLSRIKRNGCIFENDYSLCCRNPSGIG